MYSEFLFPMIRAFVSWIKEHKSHARQKKELDRVYRELTK